MIYVSFLMDLGAFLIIYDKSQSNEYVTAESHLHVCIIDSADFLVGSYPTRENIKFE